MPNIQRLYTKWMRRLSVGALLTAMYILMMGIAYVAVMHFGKRESSPGEDSAKAAEEAERLQSTFADLRNQMREYQSRVASERATPSKQFTDWITRDFLAGVNEIRRKLQQGNWPSDAFQSLLKAADKMADMAATPQQVNLREAASEELSRAEEAVDQRVGALRSGLAFLGNGN